MHATEEIREWFESRRSSQKRQIARLDRWTRDHRNTTQLIDYLRRAQVMRGLDAPILIPELATLIADILDGTVAATVKQSGRLLPVWVDGLAPDDATYVRRHIAETRRELDDPKSKAYIAAKQQSMPLETSAHKRAAAEQLVADYLKINVNAKLYPRKGRRKKG